MVRDLAIRKDARVKKPAPRHIAYIRQIGIVFKE
jgi:hypothetical protein